MDPVNPKKGAYHVHYQLRDPAGNIVNPTDFWDRQGPADSNPAPPAYLGEYQQYLQGPGANAGNGFGNAPGTANMPAPGSFDVPSDQSPARNARQTAPLLGPRIAGKSQSFFDTGTPAVPFVPPNNVVSPDRQNSFDDRFGNWSSFPVAPPNAEPSPDRQNSFDNRFGNWTPSPAPITLRNSDQPVPPPQPGRPLGIFTGKPMPLWTTPVPLGGLLNNSDASSDSDAFNLLAGLVSRNSTHPEPPQQIAGSMPERRLGRSSSTNRQHPQMTRAQQLILRRRATHRHIFIVADIQSPRREPAADFLNRAVAAALSPLCRRNFAVPCAALGIRKTR